MRFRMQREDILKHTNGKCRVVYVLVCKRKIFLSLRMSSAFCVRFSQLIDHSVT